MYNNFFQVHDPEFDKQFLISLAYLKSGNPSTYDEKITSSNDIDKPGTSESIKVEEKEKKKSKKEKLFSLRDYERKIILERDGRFSSSEDEDDTRQKVKSKTYVEEQKELRDSFRHALKDEDNEDNDLLKIKQKTEEEKHKVLLILTFFYNFTVYVLLCIMLLYFIFLGRRII